MKRHIFAVLFICWLTLSLVVRIVGLESSPASVGFDEASLGYNAYSLLLTGKDEYGNKLPLSLRSFNDFKPALYAYTAIPFIKLFGLNQTTTRLPSAIFGTVSLVFLFLIFKKVSGKSNLVSLGVLALISFFPWRIHFSRVALEANLSMAFFTGAVWCLINFNKNIYSKLGTIFFSVLSIYSYHSARVAIPILLFLVLSDPLTSIFKKFVQNPISTIISFWPLWLTLIFYIPLLAEFRANLLLTRFAQTNVFSHFQGEGIYKLVGIVLGHFFSYLSPQNLSLLIYPGVIKSAQAISGSGMLGFFGGFLFLIGFIVALRKIITDKEKRILMYWIIAGVFPAAVTWEWFYPLRSLNIYPAIDIICGLGLLAVFSFISRQKLLVALTLSTALIGACLSTSLYNTLNEFNYSAWDIGGEFQPGGFKQGVPLFMSLQDKYKTAYLDSNQAQSYEIFWFYMQYPPKEVQKLASARNAPGTEGPPDLNFGKYIYKKFSWPHDKFSDNFIYWTNSEVKENEISSTVGAKLYKIKDQTGNWVASIITKE